MKEIIEFIKDKGIDIYPNTCPPLSKFAFKVNDSLKLLEMMKNKDILVYGGDVLKYEKSSYKHTYDNWFYDEDDSLESINISIEKIKLFAKAFKNEIFITLVCDFDYYKIIKNKEIMI